MDSFADTELLTLISRCKAGSDDAFSQLVEVYKPLIKRIISDMSVHTDEAFAECCIGLYKAASSYDTEQGSVTFGLYARICMTRRLIDMLRRTRSEEDKFSDFDIENIAASGDVVSELLRKEEMREFRLRAEELLSDYEYRIFLLWLGGNKTASIASELDTTAKSVDNAKARILKKLRCGLKGLSSEQ